MNIPIVVHPWLEKPYFVDIGNGPTFYTPSVDALLEQLNREADAAGQPRIERRPAQEG